MRIMSFNLLCSGSSENVMKKRKKAAAKAIINYSPDTLGVQEATPAWMTWLKKSLTDYDFVGVGRENGKNRGEYSAVFYLREKFSLIDSGNFWLSETPEKPSKGWDAACIRICTWAVLENKEDGSRFVHINTHLDHVGPIAIGNGVDMILKKAGSFDLPVVCTGDFNLFEGGEFYQRLMSGTLRDTKHLAPDTMDSRTFHNYKTDPDVGGVIDFVLVNDKVKPLVYRVVTEEIDGRLPSDHYPVYADVELI